MKIIFLDIDGVLNNAKTDMSKSQLDPILVERFKRVMKETDARIVLSSTWRLWEDSIKQIRDVGIPIYDITPDKRGLTSRGTEIKEWLFIQSLKSDFVVKRYVIIDDNSDFHKDQPLFKTSSLEGLTEEIAEEIIKYLKN